MNSSGTKRPTLPRADKDSHAEVDYDVYAEGEAVLGWLNATITLRGKPTEWNLFAGSLLRGLSLALIYRSITSPVIPFRNGS
ncbi:MAG TPA: hypothetical protein VMW38_11625 [Terriglobia bacterium]|nr:hypothetical protein [Terriglobia bacterium]